MKGKILIFDCPLWILNAFDVLLNCTAGRGCRDWEENLPCFADLQFNSKRRTFSLVCNIYLAEFNVKKVISGVKAFYKKTLKHEFQPANIELKCLYF